MISRLNPYYKIWVIILIIFFIEKIALANGNIRLISLDEAISIGLKNNKTFLLKSELISIAAQNTYLNAKREYSRPSIDSSLSLSKKHELKVNAKQKFLLSKTGAVLSLENNYNFLKEGKEDGAETTLGLTLSQPLSPKEILTNRKILRDIEDDYSLSLLHLKTIKENLIGEIVNSYINLIRQEMSIKRSRKRIETQEELLIIADLKYKAGEMPKIDMMDIELQNKLNKINLLSEEDNYRKSKKDFLKLLGLDTETEFTIMCDLTPFLDNLPPVDEAVVRTKSYQLASAKVSLKRKEESLKEARLSKNLAVSLEAGYSTQLPFNSSKRERSDETRVGLKVEYKIYDSGIYKRNILQQQKELEMEQYNFQEMNKRIEDEVKEIYKEIDLMNKKREFLSGMERISHDLLEAAKLRFKMGVISQSELNNIVERYDKANEEIVDIKLESFLAGIRLLMLTGELSSHFIK